MGLIRKVSSVSTLGLIDFRSAKDRTASHTAQIARQSKKQTHLMRQQLAQQPAQATTTVPGWYVCPGDPPGTERLWDGAQWTANTR